MPNVQELMVAVAWVVSSGVCLAQGPTTATSQDLQLLALTEQMGRLDPEGEQALVLISLAQSAIPLDLEEEALKRVPPELLPPLLQGATRLQAITGSVTITREEISLIEATWKGKPSKLRLRKTVVASVMAQRLFAALGIEVVSTTEGGLNLRVGLSDRVGGDSLLSSVSSDAPYVRAAGEITIIGGGSIKPGEELKFLGQLGTMTRVARLNYGDSVFVATGEFNGAVLPLSRSPVSAPTKRPSKRGRGRSEVPLETPEVSETMSSEDLSDAPIDRRNLGGLDSRLRDKVERILRALQAKGWQPVVWEGKRTRAQQREKVRRGYSKTMNSKHLKGRAADIVDKRYKWGAVKKSWPERRKREVRKAEKLDFQFWRDLREEALRNGLTWGGDWKSFPDVAHVELR